MATRTGGPSKASRKKIISSAIERQKLMTNPGNPSHEGVARVPSNRAEGAGARAHDNQVRKSGNGRIFY